MDYEFKGTHLIVEIYGVEEVFTNNLDKIVKTLENGIIDGNVTNLGILSKKFLPNGITVLVLLAESHISIHTYPEKKSIFMDIFTCGDKNPENILNSILKEISFTSTNVNKIIRGNGNCNL